MLVNSLFGNLYSMLGLYAFIKKLNFLKIGSFAYYNIPGEI